MLRADPSGRLPPDELSCREQLTGLGAEFEEGAAEFDAAAGCSVPYAVILRSFGDGIAVAPPATVNCATALVASRFMREVAAPAVKEAFGEELRSVAHASGYVCRPRHNGQRMSEHAFGNALDVANFGLAGGTAVKVEQSADPVTAGFLARIRKAACGPFKTVLGPGSDADHAEHLHLDLAPRRKGGTYCR